VAHVPPASLTSANPLRGWSRPNTRRALSKIAADPSAHPKRQMRALPPLRSYE
jgi:hypothetical protein